MKKLIRTGSVFAFVLLLFTGCGEKESPRVHGNKEITTIALSGNTGAPFTAYFVEQGRRSNVTATLPWKHLGSELREFEFRKGNPGDVFWLEVHHTGYGSLDQTGSISSGGLGARLRVDYYGVSTQFISQ